MYYNAFDDRPDWMKQLEGEKTFEGMGWFDGDASPKNELEYRLRNF